MRVRRVLISLAAPLLLAGVAAGPASAAGPAPGSGTAGDPYFPRQGNGGYDVVSYSLNVRFDPVTKRLDGLANILVTATQAQSRFDLDLRRTMRVSSVEVDGVAAAFSQPAESVQELVITPRHALAAGHRFTVRVQYGGTAKPIFDPDGAIDGFVPTDDGGLVASEPQGSPTWFPVNDTPRDKATYFVRATVPTGYQAVSNGVLLHTATAGASTTYSWLMDDPISSYLVTLAVGKFRIVTGTTPGGVPYYSAVDPSQLSALRTLERLPAIVDYFSSVYGAYPFASAGAIVDHANLGYALETATRPVFDRAPDVLVLAHELAHQWYGDTVTLSRWRDIWLNEGFAQFSTWLWDEHTGGTSGHQHLLDLLAHPASDTGFWNPPPGNPGTAENIFAGSVYDRGAGTLQALREKVGSPTFFKIMRGWLAAHRYGNARVEQFTAYASSVAHQDLTHFFHVWLYRPGKPSGW